jgi:hypothetical protein
MSTESNAKIFSVIGGCRRSGRWLVPHETAMLTLFGRAVIDLRQARTTAEELEFTCTSVFANVTFIVPEGAEVRPSGMAIFGSSKSVVPVSEVACELPSMAIEATTVFGRLRIRTTEEAPIEDETRRQRRRRRKAEARRQVQGEPAAIADGTPAAGATQPAAAPLFVPVDTSQFGRPDPVLGPEAFAPAAPPKDLSSPIEAFGEPPEPERSPLTAADVPGSLAGTVLDDEPTSAPTGTTLGDETTTSGDDTVEAEPEPNAPAFGAAPEASAPEAPDGSTGDAEVDDELAAAEG